MITKSRLLKSVIAVFVATLAVGCSSSRNPALNSAHQGDIIAYDIRGPDSISGDTQYSAFAIFDDNTEEDFTNALTWQSDDNSIVFFLGDYPGLAFVAGTGDVTIHAYEMPIVGDKSINVSP